MSKIIEHILFFIVGVFWSFVIVKIENKKYLNYKKQQNTHVYCPICNNELVKNGNLIRDTDFVYYRCSKCGHKSKWDFDTPCPILIEEDGEYE